MAMSIDASTLYNSDYYKTSSATSELESKLNSSDLSSADEDELMDVCKEFEHILLNSF